MPPITANQVIMIVIGVIVIIAGVTLLRLRPRIGPAGGDDTDTSDDEPGPPLGLSEPSRLTIAVVLLVVGYHLAMWAMPPQWASAVAVPSDRWYFVAGGAAIAVFASLMLDRLARQRGEL